MGGCLVCVYEEVEKGGGGGWLDPNIQQLWTNFKKVKPTNKKKS